ncbi:response regulator [Chloroflexota bacterium]
MSIKVLIADDHKMMCEGLHYQLCNSPGIEVVGAVNNGREAVEMAQKVKPNIVIMDLNMPDLNGFEATRIIRSRSSSVRILVLSMYVDSLFVANALKAGASGYVLKDRTFEDLVEAIRIIDSGQIYLSPEIVTIVVSNYFSKDKTESASEVLTSREREVVQLIAEGKRTKEIAATLCISPRTVGTHMRHIKVKLNTDSVVEVSKHAIREGIAFL